MSINKETETTGVLGWIYPRREYNHLISVNVNWMEWKFHLSVLYLLRSRANNLKYVYTFLYNSSQVYKHLLICVS